MIKHQNHCIWLEFLFFWCLWQNIQTFAGSGWKRDYVSWYGCRSRRWTCWPLCRPPEGLVCHSPPPSWQCQSGTSDPLLEPDRTEDLQNRPDIHSHRVRVIIIMLLSCIFLCRVQHSSDLNSPCKRPFLQTAPRHTAYVERRVRSSSCTQSGSLRTLLLSGAQREALYLQGGKCQDASWKWWYKYWLCTRWRI